VHLGLTSLLEFYSAHREDEALVLGTVISIEGSSYRKPGAMMLIAADGQYCGLISGGCLESDLSAHADEVFSNGVTSKISYDLSHSDDFAWGLGLGCDGTIHLMLQRLDASDSFGFLETLQQAWAAKSAGLLSLVTSSSSPDHLAGTFALSCGAKFKCGNSVLLNSTHSKEGTIFSNGHDMSRRFWHDRIETGNGQLEVLLIPVMPPPALLICGAGHDALPVAHLAVEMGWDCTLVDHRSGFARAERFPKACTVLNMQASELNSNLSLGEFDAAVVMSHHLEYDRHYLQQISQAGISYIGLLGPTARKDRLISEIGIKDIQIHGPAGLDIGAEMPESIALAIIAEIHAVLNQRQGDMLSSKTT